MRLAYLWSLMRTLVGCDGVLVGVGLEAVV